MAQPFEDTDSRHTAVLSGDIGCVCLCVCGCMPPACVKQLYLRWQAQVRKRHGGLKQVIGRQMERKAECAAGTGAAVGWRGRSWRRGGYCQFSVGICQEWQLVCQSFTICMG